MTASNQKIFNYRCLFSLSITFVSRLFVPWSLLCCCCNNLLFFDCLLLIEWHTIIITISINMNQISNIKRSCQYIQYCRLLTFMISPTLLYIRKAHEYVWCERTCIPSIYQRQYCTLRSQTTNKKSCNWKAILKRRARKNTTTIYENVK